MESIDTNNFMIDGSKYAFSILESPEVRQMMEWYKNNLISQEQFLKYYECRPVGSIVLEKKEGKEEVAETRFCPNCGALGAYRTESILVWECLDCYFRWDGKMMSKDYEIGVDLAKEEKSIISRFEILDIRE